MTVLQPEADAFTAAYFQTNIAPSGLPGFQIFDVASCTSVEPPKTVLVWELKRIECVGLLPKRDFFDPSKLQTPLLLTGDMNTPFEYFPTLGSDSIVFQVRCF